MIVARIEEGRRIVHPAHAVPPTGAVGAALHAVDPEQEIERAADDGREPRDADPGEGRRHVALALQHVQGDRAGQHDMQQRPEDRAGRPEG